MAGSQFSVSKEVITCRQQRGAVGTWLSGSSLRGGKSWTLDSPLVPILPLLLTACVAFTSDSTFLKLCFFAVT